MCLAESTGNGSSGSSPDTLTESAPVTAAETYGGGEHTVTLSCGPDQIAIDPGYQFDAAATVRSVEPSNNNQSITFITDVPEAVSSR